MTHSALAWRDRIVVGMIAFASVALFYSVFDLLAARGALHTVDLLGRTLFKGLRDPSLLLYPIQPDAAAILWYSGFHLVVSLAIGLIVTGLVEHAERHPARATLMLLSMSAGFLLTILGVGLMTGPLRGLLPWWSIALANGLATLLAGWYLLKRRPGLWGRLRPAAD